MLGTNHPTKENHKFYNSTVQFISREGADCTTNILALCARFVYMGAPVKARVLNGLINILDLRVQTIDMSDQAVFNLKG